MKPSKAYHSNKQQKRLFILLVLEIICDLGKILQKKKRILINNHQVAVKLDSVMKYFTYLYDISIRISLIMNIRVQVSLA